VQRCARDLCPPEERALPAFAETQDAFEGRGIETAVAFTRGEWCCNGCVRRASTPDGLDGRASDRVSRGPRGAEPLTTHLSTRILWHDRGWDGHICDCPVENSSCLVQQHVRESRDDKLEMDCSAIAMNALDGWLPPCSRDINAFSAKPFRITHRDPLEWRALPPVDEDLPPYSVHTAPYRWMREEHLADIVDKYQIDVPPPDDRSREQGWVNEPQRQRLLLKRFWDQLEVGRSLIFFYCNHGNPLERGPSRLLVGASRISEMGTQLMFGKTPNYGADHPVWSRRISHAYPVEGVRLPLQEYVSAGYPLDGIACPAPDGGGLAFSFVAEHVSDDLAVGALERLVQAVETVKHHSLVPGDWGRALAWLDDALADTWTERGAAPRHRQRVPGPRNGPGSRLPAS
jgi:exodeoxyribonuclease V alpha subunit